MCWMRESFNLMNPTQRSGLQAYLQYHFQASQFYVIYFLKIIFKICLFLSVLALRCCAGCLQFWQAGLLQLWYVDFSLQWLLLLQSRGFRARISVVVTGTSLPLSKRDPPRLRIEPMSPALAGRLLTTGPLGKSLLCLLAVGQYRYEMNIITDTSVKITI